VIMAILVSLQLVRIAGARDHNATSYPVSVSNTLLDIIRHKVHMWGLYGNI